MKKSLFAALIISMLATVGAAFAQVSDVHDVTIKIPDLLKVRIVDDSGDLATSPSVTFDFQTDPTNYIGMVNAGGGDLAPTGVSEFGDVEVFSNSTPWTLYVRATGFSFSDDYSAGLGADGIALSDIKVKPTGTAGTNVNPPSDFTLPDSSANQVTTGGITGGWQSVGFNGKDYWLNVSGDENPGTYTTTVTYSFTAP